MSDRSRIPKKTNTSGAAATANAAPAPAPQPESPASQKQYHSQPEIFSDATNRLAIDSPTAPAKSHRPANGKSGGILKGSGSAVGRKSLPASGGNAAGSALGSGARRVSFAATAHVRVFEREQQRRAEAEAEAEAGAESEAGNKENKAADEHAEDEELSMAAFRQQFTPSQQSETDELKASFGAFGLHSDPNSSAVLDSSVVSVGGMGGPSTPSKHMSFEVELKSEEQPSFSSYLSPESKDMDLTGCVGDILDELSSPLSAHHARNRDNANVSRSEGAAAVSSSAPVADSADDGRRQTMDFTNCVGSILAQIGAKDEMEMTQAVGQILPSAPLQMSQMEMTQPVGSIDVNPFLSAARETGPGLVSANSPDVSFIGDVDVPAAFNNVMSPSQQPAPVAIAQVLPSRLGQQQTTAQDLAAMMDVDSSVSVPQEVDPKAELKAMEQEISAKVDRESLAIAQAAVTAQRKESIGMFQAFVSQAGAANSEAMGGSAATPSVLEGEAKADLREFLNETGVRFLDNLSNMGRRETAGRPRDSMLMTPARRIFASSVLIPEAGAVERACSESIRTINAQRELLVEEEARFNHHPPLAWRECSRLAPGDSAERTALLAKLRTLKSVGRLFARHSWYEWRRGFEAGLLEELERVRDGLQAQYASLQEAQAVFASATGPTLDSALQSARSRLQELRRRYEALSRSDWQEAIKLHSKVLSTRVQVQEADEHVQAAAHAETVHRSRLDAGLEERRKTAEAIEQLRHTAAQFDDCTELALKELKSSRALQEALNGWRLAGLKANGTLMCDYLRSVNPSAGNGDPLRVSFHFNPATFDVKAVVIETSNGNGNADQHSSASSGSLLARFAARFVSNQEGSLLKALPSVMLQLDRLVQLERDLNAVGVFCQASVIAHEQTSTIPIQLSFFNYEAKIKFDVLLGAGMDSSSDSKDLAFVLLGATNHYGPVSTEQVVAALAMANDRPQSLKSYASKLAELVR